MSKDEPQDLQLIKVAMEELELERASTLFARDVDRIDAEIHKLKALLKEKS